MPASTQPSKAGDQRSARPGRPDRRASRGSPWKDRRRSRRGPVHSPNAPDDDPPKGRNVARHSKHERERRSTETERVKQIEAAWLGSLPAAGRRQGVRRIGRGRPRPSAAGEAAGHGAGHDASPAAPRPRAEAAQGRATAPPPVDYNNYIFTTPWASPPRRVGSPPAVGAAGARGRGSFSLRFTFGFRGPAGGAAAGRLVVGRGRGFLRTRSAGASGSPNRPDPGFRLDAGGQGADLDPRSGQEGQPGGPLTSVTYDWLIIAEKGVLKRLSPIMKPIFSANHRVRLGRGEPPLARRQMTIGRHPGTARPIPQSGRRSRCRTPRRRARTSSC